MPEHYYQHDHHHKQHHLAKRFKWFVGGSIVAVLIIIAILFFTTNLFVHREVPSPTSTVRTTIQAPSISIFRSPYFQFQAKDSWTEITKGTKDGQYFYRSYRGNLIEQDLMIYVDPKPVDLVNLRSSRVLPVTVEEDGSLKKVEDISDKCGKGKRGQNLDPRRVTFRGVTFTCIPDGVIFDVVVGEQKGDTVLRLLRPDGVKVNLVMYYRDLRANPDGRDLLEIVDSFQAR